MFLDSPLVKFVLAELSAFVKNNIPPTGVVSGGSCGVDAPKLAKPKSKIARCFSNTVLIVSNLESELNTLKNRISSV